MKGAVAAASKGAAALFCWRDVGADEPACRIAVLLVQLHFSPDTRSPMLYFVKPIGFTVFSPRE